ncbi:MAG: hypothetical protein IIA85_03240 [Nanoarchaeota archaeon]|nr:hypothetical protein [Nanoarchaeota archaeon]
MAKKTKRKVKDFVPESSRVDVPPKLVLMPKERLLGNHLDFFVTNKRIIKHKEGVFGHRTTDYTFKHIKGLEDVNKRPFLTAGLIIGIILLLIGFALPFFFILGAIIIILAFWYKVSGVVVYHIDGDEILIPNIKDGKSKELLKILRTQVYDKN